jgi:glycosyltransferase involved in cell wall biosynthesis
MRLSIIVPAYNEEKYLPATLEALARTKPNDAEIIVVDNESTDTTREIAKSFGARVVDEQEHNIGKVRNTGAEAASGNVLIFLDADTIVRPGTFEKINDALKLDESCFGGASEVEYEPIENRIVIAWFMLLWPFLGKLTKMRGGALQFCRTHIFRELNGYDTTIWVGEDLDFHWRLDKLASARGGHTTLIEEPKVLTSSRRWNKMGLIRMMFFTHPTTVLLAWRVRSFWKDWYDNPIR